MRQPEKARPGPYRQRWNRMWIDIWTVLTEYGPLVVFLALTIGLDLARSTLRVESVFYRVVLFAELVTIITMVGPKALRGIGELLQTLAVVAHDIVYSFRRGFRRRDSRAPEGRKTPEVDP